ncbi:MAG TPA: alternative ribosome rescue aminoacyl-tRNA hydrolase ArfB [Gemmataceae bacterium]|nr:alternative ribosome rescue aminoacyl-tRNA hydrolase ArfB [Gemmataceae bacterium]
MIQVNEALSIPDDELVWSYARSGGPGGQNVNKVSSKAVLRWKAAASAAPIPLPAWDRMKARFPSRFTVEGDVVISSQATRDQDRNRLDCEAKLAEMVRAALVEPKPRKKSKPGKAAKRRRVADKRRQSAKKQARRSPGDEE